MHQSQLDEVNQCAQALLDTNTDARISHTITQLSTKYQTLVSKSKVRTVTLDLMDTEHPKQTESEIHSSQCQYDS